MKKIYSAIIQVVVVYFLSPTFLLWAQDPYAIRIKTSINSFYTGACEDGILEKGNEWRLKHGINNGALTGNCLKKDIDCEIWWADVLGWEFNNSYMIGSTVDKVASDDIPLSDGSFNHHIYSWEEDFKGDCDHDPKDCIARLCPCFGGCCFCVLHEEDDADQDIFQGHDIYNRIPYRVYTSIFNRNNRFYATSYKWIPPQPKMPQNVDGRSDFCAGEVLRLATEDLNFNSGFNVSYHWQYSEGVPGNWIDITNQDTEDENASSIRLNYKLPDNIIVTKPIYFRVAYKFNGNLYTNTFFNGETPQSNIYNTSNERRDTYSQHKAFNVSAAPVESINKVLTNIDCKGNSTGKAELSRLSGGSASLLYTITFVGGANVVSSYSGTFENLSAGSYIVAVINNTPNAGQCSSFFNFALTEPAKVLSNSALGSDHYGNGYAIRCYNNDDGSIESIGDGGTPPYRMWLESSGYAGAPAFLNTTIPGRLEGIKTFFNNLSLPENDYSQGFTVRIKDANDCIAASSVNLTQPKVFHFRSSPLTDKNDYEISCFEGNDGKIRVTAAGGVISKRYTVNVPGTYIAGAAYKLNGNATLSINEREYDGLGFNNNTALLSPTEYSYSISVKDSNQCIVDTVLSLHSPERLHVNPEPPIPLAPSCFAGTDGAITITGAGGVRTTSGIGVRGYTYYVSNDVPDNVIRDGAYQLTFTGSVPVNQSYFISRMQSGFYNFTVTDANMCVYENNFRMTQPTKLTALPTLGYVTCKGDSDGVLTPAVYGGTKPYRFLWRTTVIDTLGTYNSTVTGAASDIISFRISDLSHNKYLLQALDYKDCGLDENAGGGFQMAVVQPVYPLSLTSDNNKQVGCYGETTGSINLTGSGGYSGLVVSLDGVSFQKGGALQYSSDSSTFKENGFFSGLTKGPYKFYVKDVTTGCVESKIETVREPLPLQMALSKTDINCFGVDNGIVNISVSGGSYPFLYSISGKAFQTDNEFRDLSPGSYQAIVKDESNCISNTILFNLTQPGLFLGAAIRQDATCGESNGSAVITFTGGTLPYTLQTLIQHREIFETSLKTDSLRSGNYLVMGRDAQNCVASVPFFIRDRNGPEVSVNVIKNARCFDSEDGEAEVVASAKGGKHITSYQWFDPLGNIVATTTSAIAMKGSESFVGNQYYLVAVSDNDGCIGTEDVFIPSPKTIKIFLEATNPTCYNDSDGKIVSSVTGGNGGYTYLWNDSLAQTSFYAKDLSVKNNSWPIANGQAVATYKLLVTDSKNCTAKDSVHLINPKDIKIEFPEGDSAFVCTGQTLVLDAGTDGNAYKWTSDIGLTSEAQTIVIDKNGTYEVTVTNTKGCVAKRKFKLLVSSDLLKASFALSTNLVVGDTSLLAEISWPVPDSIRWELPLSFKVTSIMRDRLYVIADSIGTYEIGLDAYMALCADHIKKHITVTPRPTQDENGGRVGYSGIKTYKVFPNPAASEVNLNVKLTEEMPIWVRIFGPISAQPLVFQKGGNLQEYNFSFDISGFTPGIYFIEISTSNSRRVAKMVKE